MGTVLLRSKIIFVLGQHRNKKQKKNLENMLYIFAIHMYLFRLQGPTVCCKCYKRRSQKEWLLPLHSSTRFFLGQPVRICFGEKKSLHGIFQPRVTIIFLRSTQTCYRRYQAYSFLKSKFICQSENGAGLNFCCPMLYYPCT